MAAGWCVPALVRAGDLLLTLGKPSVVAVSLRLAAQPKAPYFTPELPRLFAARLLGLPEIHGDVFYYGPVAAKNIVGIWQPGPSRVRPSPTPAANVIAA